MRNWVKPFLLKTLREGIKEKYGNWEEGQKIFLEMSRELESEVNVSLELTDYLQTQFGYGSNADTEIFRKVFGSVLVDLPRKVFSKICRMKNVFFIFTPKEGTSEVKVFNLENGIRKGQALRIVNFPYSVVSRPIAAMRGTFVHELAHVFLDHDPERDDPKVIERKADQAAKNWGFKKEIKALKDYWAEVYSHMEKS